MAKTICAFLLMICLLVRSSDSKLKSVPESVQYLQQRQCSFPEKSAYTNGLFDRNDIFTTHDLPPLRPCVPTDDPTQPKLTDNETMLCKKLFTFAVHVCQEVETSPDARELTEAMAPAALKQDGAFTKVGVCIKFEMLNDNLKAKFPELKDFLNCTDICLNTERPHMKPVCEFLVTALQQYVNVHAEKQHTTTSTPAKVDKPPSTTEKPTTPSDAGTVQTTGATSNNDSTGITTTEASSSSFASSQTSEASNSAGAYTPEAAYNSTAESTTWSDNSTDYYSETTEDYNGEVRGKEEGDDQEQGEKNESGEEDESGTNIQSDDEEDGTENESGEEDESGTNSQSDDEEDGTERERNTFYLGFLPYFLVFIVGTLSVTACSYYRVQLKAYVCGSLCNDRRPDGAKYIKLKNNLEEALPPLDRAVSPKNFVY